ncbi:hypothetical protein E2C01_000387 [Portunus trituberculatus]|uniref:Uncharacterized protein n=1 Tax=Portunus trituberculatus TaxID=210409 RepID=A0A5B7CF26_PORTR|nr:hypothetical protein [Portunus trituberculatus]
MQPSPLTQLGLPSGRQSACEFQRKRAAERALQGGGETRDLRRGDLIRNNEDSGLSKTASRGLSCKYEGLMGASLMVPPQ